MSKSSFKLDVMQQEEMKDLYKQLEDLRKDVQQAEEIKKQNDVKQRATM